jgi:hypothetical protein
MRVLTWDDFADAEGRAYCVRLVEVMQGESEPKSFEIELVLAKASVLPSGIRDSQAFRLEFLGPQAPILPQACYRLEHANEADDIFIVPVANDAQGTTYEAIFN